MSLADRTPPTPAEYERYMERFNNWGRWGENDERGTLNFITPGAVAAAARLVREGLSVSLSRPLATRAVMPEARNMKPVRRELSIDRMGCSDSFEIDYHGFANTHIDALCHIFTGDGRMFGGHASSAVQPGGARRNAVDAWRDGIVTRGVLYDVPRFRGVPHVPLEEPVHGWELLDIARAEGITPATGDAVVIRAGAEAFWSANPHFERPWEAPGIHASVLEFLWETDASLMLWDLMEAGGQDGYDAPALPIHTVAIPYMGLPLVDNADLEALSRTCAQLRRHEFQFVIAPLVVTGGTGSPVNPLALF